MSCCHDPTLKRLFIMKRCGLALCLAILINGHGQTLAANYPISGAWTVAPTNSRQIVYVRHACQAFRRKEDLTLKAAAGRLVILRAGESTWYNNIGTRVCQNVVEQGSRQEVLSFGRCLPRKFGAHRAGELHAQAS